MSDAKARLAALAALRNTPPQPAPGNGGEPPSVPVPPSGVRGRRGSTNGRPRGNPSKKDRYATAMLSADTAADLARLCATLRDAIDATGRSRSEVTKASGFSRLPQYLELDLKGARRMRLSTLKRICEAAGMPSNAAADMASKAPHAIAPEEGEK